MKTVNNNLPKQLLFFLTLLLAFTPACKQQKQSLAGAHSEIAAGTIITAGGIAAVPVLTAATGLLIAIGHVSLLAVPICIPIALFAVGIPLIVDGVKKRRAIKKQRLLEKLKQEQQAREQKESEEIQEHEDNEDENDQKENIQD